MTYPSAPDCATPPTNEILSTALEFLSAGYSVIPVLADGSKRPAVAWKKYQERRASADEIYQWFSNSDYGLGLICGAISGAVEMVELEAAAVAQGSFGELGAIAHNSGLGSLWDSVVQGYCERSPSGGVHFLYRITDAPVPGNTKLASAQAVGGRSDCLAETRGEGGYVIIAPTTGAVHASGAPWQLLSGGVSTIACLSWEERTALINLFRLLDTTPAPIHSEPVASAIERNSGSLLPGDDFNARASWDEILIPHGWSKVYTANGVSYWRRPGKSEGISATTGRNEADNLYVFTTSTVFTSQVAYSKFSALATLDFGGDFKACARHLRAIGYGSIALVQPDSSALPAPVSAPALPASPTGISQGLGQSLDNEMVGASTHSDGIDNGDEVAFKSRQEVEFEYQLQQARIRARVKQVLDSEVALKTYGRITFIPNLTEELAQPDEEVDWTIEGLIPSGANVTLTAQYKAGKTTLVNNLAKSLADGTRFLNYFKPAVHPGRVVIFNYEVSNNQYKRWLRDVAIEKTDRVTTVHLRGKAVPMISDYVRKDIIELLQSLNCQTWIIDPFARAFTGSGDENSNSDVGIFLDQLDIVKERAGVSNLILPVHTGRAQEFGIDRARGATRIDDWADVRWLLKKTDDGRFFSADGRDVMLDEQMLRFDGITRHLTLGGADARTAKKQNLEDLWVETVYANPGKSTGDLCRILNRNADDKALRSARKDALFHKKIKSQEIARTTFWWPIDAVVPTQMEVITA